MPGINLTREQLDRMIAGGASVRKPAPPEKNPAPQDHAVFVEKMTAMVERMGQLNLHQLERVEVLLREMRRPVPPIVPPPVVRRLTVNRNARGFIESVDVETDSLNTN